MFQVSFKQFYLLLLFLAPVASGALPGDLDGSFSVGAGPGNRVRCMDVFETGDILIAGDFFGYNGTTRRQLARIQPSGEVDTNFSSGAGLGFNGTADKLIIKGDKAYLLGTFSTYNGQSLATFGFIRINADGSLDRTFVPEIIRADNTDFFVQNDGKIVLSTGHSTTGITRLNSDGSIDSSFAPPSEVRGARAFHYRGTNFYAATVRSLQTTNGTLYSYQMEIFSMDGKVLKSAPFDGRVTKLAGGSDGVFALYQPGLNMATNNLYLKKVNADGQLVDLPHKIEAYRFDATTFATIEIDPYGRILLSARTNQIDGIYAKGFLALTSNGEIDPSFNPDFSVSGGGASAIAIKGDYIYLGGLFTRINGKAQNRLARIFGGPRFSPTPLKFHRFQISSGRLTLGISAKASSSYILEAANALGNRWTPISTNSGTQGDLEFTIDPILPSQFFRIREE